MKSVEIMANIDKVILGGVKIPHGMSQLLIHEENNQYYLAIFVFFFSRSDIEHGKVDRPTLWALLDIKTGELIQKRNSRDMDFSDTSYDIKYDVTVDDKYDISKNYYEEAYELLDLCRNSIIEKNKFDETRYRTYFNKIIANIPKEYRQFYFDLSI